MQSLNTAFMGIVVATSSGCAVDLDEDKPESAAMDISVESIALGQIQNRPSSLCLTPQNRNTTNASTALVSQCTSEAVQHWRVGAVTWVGTFFGWQLTNGLGSCLGVHAASTTSGELAVVGPCGLVSDHSQIWRPLVFEDGELVGFDSEPSKRATYWLWNGHSGLCLGMQGSSTGNNVAVVQGNCTTTSQTQQWRIRLP